MALETVEDVLDALDAFDLLTDRVAARKAALQRRAGPMLNRHGLERWLSQQLDYRWRDLWSQISTLFASL